MQRDARHHIDGIGDDEKERVGVILGQQREEGRKDVRVAFHEVQARFSRFLTGSRGDDHEAATLNFVCVAHGHGGMVGERQAMLQIHVLAFGAKAVVVVEHDLARGSGLEHGIRGRGPDRAHPDDGGAPDAASKAHFALSQGFL